jgi:predicted DNA-binding protein with PD1-like motif
MEDVNSLLQGIGWGKMHRIIAAKLNSNTDLLDGITELVRREGIQTGVFLSAVGALRKAIFRNVKVMPPDYKVNDSHRFYLELEQPMEIVSLTGWIATKEDGNVEVHAHFSASTILNNTVATLGGHLVPGVITSIKVVVLIGIIEDTNIRAALDSRIGQIDLVF